MKRLLLTYAIAATCIGLSSTVMADLTSTQTGSPEPESYGTYTVKHNSEDSDFFAEDWLYWLLDDVFGWRQRHRGQRYYYYGQDDLGFDSGDGGWDYDFGADAWSFGSGDGGCGFDYGDTDPTDTDPPRQTPAPGAFVLGGIGLALAGWLGHRKKCMAQHELRIRDNPQRLSFGCIRCHDQLLRRHIEGLKPLIHTNYH